MLNVGWVSSVYWIDRLTTMSEQPSKLAGFMGELRRCHVFRVAVGYPAVAFVVLQPSEIVLIDPELPEAHDILALIE